MYIPDAFKVVDDASIDAFLERYDFATLISAPASGLIVTHLPVLVRREATGLVIAGHVARGNPHWQLMDGVLDGVALFSGPHGYISPTWYEHSPAVPTWNYAVVHAHGKPRVRDDRQFVETVVNALATRYESHRPRPWRLDDQPADFGDRMLTAVVGFEMTVSRVEATFKLNQNRRPEDRAGVIAGLERDGAPGAAALAQFMRDHHNG
jgi:transcriptional regulator